METSKNELETLCTDCKKLVDERKMKIEKILQSVIKFDKDIFTQKGNLRQQYYYLVNPANTFNIENKIEKLEKLKNAISSIEISKDEILNYAIVYFTFIVYRYGCLTITKRGNKWIKAEINVFQDMSTSESNTPSYKLEADEKNITQDSESVSINFSEKKSTLEQKQNLHIIANILDHKTPSFFIGSYSSISRIKGGSTPTAGIMAFTKTDIGHNALEKIYSEDKAKFNNVFQYKEVDKNTSNSFESLAFIEYFLRNKRLVGTHNIYLEDQRKLTEYETWSNIYSKRGLYVCWTIRSWSANYRTFDRFLIIIEKNGQVLLFANDLNPFTRYGFIHSAEGEHLILHFSDEKSNNNIRFTMTFVPDPTTLSENHSLESYIGVTSGLEKILTPTSGKVVMIKADENISSEIALEAFKIEHKSNFAKHFQPKSESTATGLKYVIDDFYNDFTKYFKIKKQDPHYLSNIFSPENFYDFSDTNVLVRNWLGNQKRSKEIIHLLIFSNSGSFHVPNSTKSELNIYMYPMRIDANHYAQIKTLNSNFLSGDCKTIRDFLVFSCYQRNEEKNKEFFIQGTIKDWSCLVKDTKISQKLYSEGIINVHSKESGYLKSSRIIILRDTQNFANFEEWNEYYSSEKRQSFRYNLAEHNDIKELNKVKNGLDKHLRGHLNRLIVTSSINNKEFPPRFEENIILYFYGACYAAQIKDKSTTEKYLTQAWIHTFPNNSNHMSLFSKELFSDNGALRDYTMKVEELWGEEFVLNLSKIYANKK